MKLLKTNLKIGIEENISEEEQKEIITFINRVMSQSIIPEVYEFNGVRTVNLEWVSDE